MTYEFTTDKVGKVILNNFKTAGKSFTIHGVDAQLSDANIIIGGVNRKIKNAVKRNTTTMYLDLG